MAPVHVTLMSLLVTVNYGSIAGVACPAGCSCVSSSINCCESDGYFQIPISGFDNATKLSLSACPRLVIARHSIWTMKDLEDVSIRRTPITYIDASAFGALLKLKNLALNELNLSMTNFHPSAFADLPVQQLDLKNNNLKIILRQMFSGLKNLRVLNLSRNKIALIQNEAFQGLALLSMLNLDDNNLRSVSPSWFEPFGNYSSLHISIAGNNLTSECQFRGIDLLENRWFRSSIWPNDSLESLATDIPTCTLPVFSNSYQEMYVRESALVTLPCSASGTPKPTLTWLLPTGLEVSPFSITNGVLTIPVANVTDSGLYSCVASNSEGVSVALTRLSVISIPMTMAVTPQLIVTNAPKKKASLLLIIIFIILLASVLVFVLGYIARLIYRLAKKPDNDNFEFSRFVNTPNILSIPENSQPMPHV